GRCLVSRSGSSMCKHSCSTHFAVIVCSQPHSFFCLLASLSSIHLRMIRAHRFFIRILAYTDRESLKMMMNKPVLFPLLCCLLLDLTGCKKREPTQPTPRI